MSCRQCVHCNSKKSLPRCPRCNSRNHYIKEARNSHFCRSCGYLWPVVVDDTVIFSASENRS